MTNRGTAYARTSDADRPILGRRLTWEQFYQMRPDRRPANDNEPIGRSETPRPPKAHTVRPPQR